MFKVEKRIIDFLVKYRKILFFVIIVGIGVYVRIKGLDFKSGDMKFYLLPWFEKIKEGGFASLSEQVGNYNLLYQTLIALMTKINIDPVHQYKYLSMIGDFYLAFCVARLCCVIKEKKLFSNTFLCVFAAAFLLPTAVMNSAFWGQCDSLHTAFMVSTLIYAYKKKWTFAFVMFGIAFAFKLQAIFLLPFLVLIYFYQKDFSIFHGFMSVAVFWLSGTVCYIFGRNMLSAFTVYLQQTGEYKHMFMNFPSFWMIFADKYDFNPVALITTVTIFGVVLLLVLSGKIKFDSADKWLAAACFSVWTCVLFLPSMHDRYAYPLDMLLIALAFIKPKYIKFAIIAAISSLAAYAPFLAQGQSLTVWHAVIYTAVYVWFSIVFFKDCFVLTKPETNEKIEA